MCGIAGIVTRDPILPGLSEAVPRMAEALTHRGPDDSGQFRGRHVQLASRRLSIIDIAGGAQPMLSDDGSTVLVMNGEIYNYIELQNELGSAGVELRTRSDSEVVLRLYERDGLDFVQRLRGMFALAIWDGKLSRLVLARDRMGEKPLYLHQTEGRLIFASEMKGLLSSGLVPFEVDPSSVDKYFLYQYVPEPATAVKGVTKLDAATVMTVDVGTWEISKHTYWRMEDAVPRDGDPGEIIREKIGDVSSIVVRSDVPVGVALSGGLDSSTVAAFAAREHSDIRAFSVGYAGRPPCDERNDAKRLADHLKIPFYDVELDTASVVKSFSDLNRYRDDPVADIAGFGYYAAARLARGHGVSVLLQGQGGDELFWGYPQLRDAIASNLSRLRKNTLSRVASAITGKRRSLDFYSMSEDYRGAVQQRHHIYGSAVEAEVFAERIPFPADATISSLEIELTSLVCATYLRCNGIVQGDRLGMASSVEMRLPFLEHEFVETVVGLRKVQSDSSLPPKQWLIDAVRGIVPDWVLTRPKRGFEPPTGAWHAAIFERHGTLLVDGYLTANGLLDKAAASRMAAGEYPTQGLAFKALVLEQWCREMSSIANGG